MIDPKKPYIICSAIWFPHMNTPPFKPVNIAYGAVVSGRRHSDCFNSLRVLEMPDHKDPRTKGSVQGFLTSDNRFMNRFEAMVFAKRIGQVSEKLEKNILFSEDLY